MSISKVGGLADGVGVLWRGALRAPGIGKKVLGPMGNAAAGAAKYGLKGADATGKFIVEKPKTSLGIAAIGGYGAYRAKKNIKKQMTHVDPDQQYTVSAPISGVRYRSPQHEELIRQRNLFY